MEQRAITFSSQTAAFRAQRILRKHGIQTVLIRPDPKQTPRGCAWALAIDILSIHTAIYDLEREKISFGDVIRI